MDDVQFQVVDLSRKAVELAEEASDDDVKRMLTDAAETRQLAASRHYSTIE